MATLYNKYRPQAFAEAVGQNHIKITLEHEISAGKIAHAYLFCGPRAVGKTTFARLVAKAVNCQNRKEGEFEPCNKCASCQEITAGRALDIVEMDAASNTGIDNVRENIISSARVAPSHSKYKVYIIDEVHGLSAASFQALLKTIEEPPNHVIFILCTTETHKVPATIISRCERFDFKRISLDDIVKKLSFIVREEKIKVEKSILEEIARQSEGHMRDAESLLGQLVSIAGNEITSEEADLVIPRSDLSEIVNLLEQLIKKDASSAIALVNKLLDDGVDLEKFMDDFIEILRKVLLGKINPALGERLGLDIGESFELKINELKAILTPEQLINFLEKFIEARSKMKSSFIIQLPMEMAIAEICLEINSSVNKIAPASFPSSRSISSAGASFNKTYNKPSEPAIFSESANGTLDIPNILAKWSEVLAKVKTRNHSLSFVLRVCQPRDVIGNKVCLVFKYKFHKDRIDEAKMREIVQTVFREVYGTPLFIEATVDENLEIEENANNNSPVEEKKEVPSDDLMGGMLKAFGGKIIG